MSNGPSKNSVRNQARTALNRLDELEETVTKLVGAINNVFAKSNKRVTTLEEIANAVSTLLGPEKVSEVVMNARKQALVQKEEEKQKALDLGVSEGFVSKTEVITETSVLYVKETDANGNVMGTGRDQFDYSEIDPPFNSLLLGKTAGWVMDTPSGGKLEVLEVYAVDRQKAQEYVESEMKKAQEAMEQAKAVAETTETVMTGATPPTATEPTPESTQT